jgi:hypothetical protein
VVEDGWVGLSYSPKGKQSDVARKPRQRPSNR